MSLRDKMETIRVPGSDRDRILSEIMIIVQAHAREMPLVEYDNYIHQAIANRQWRDCVEWWEES